MKKRTFKIIGIAIVLVTVLVAVLAVSSLAVSAMTAKNMEKTLQSLQSESDYIPAVAAYGKAYLDGKTYDLYEAVKDYNEDFLLEQVLCVYHGRFYLHVSDVNKSEYIASVGMEKLDLSIHAQFDLPDHRMSSDVSVAYRDGTVTVTDGVTVLEYDVVNDESNAVLAEDVSFPETSSDDRVSIADAEKIELTYHGKTEQFDFSKIAETSAGAAKLYGYKDKKTWCGDSRFDGLYVSDAWSAVDGRIYVAAKCKGFDGTVFACVLEYLPDENKWVYVSGGYDCAGSMDGEYGFRIVPRP